MKLNRFISLLACVAVILVAAAQGVTSLPEGEYTNNLPCRLISINPQKPGKALLFLWLHGGVHDRKSHDLFREANHLNYCAADDSIVNYLKRHGIKAVAMFPVCHRAVEPNCVDWLDCYDDIKHMIDDLVDKGIVDSDRIYLAGSSDGGAGTWDFASTHPEVFVAAISMSCSMPRQVAIPVFFFSTGHEGDCTERVEPLVRHGAPIQYKYCPQYKHGGDAAECTDALLTKFFGLKKTKK